jgi:hypothetical protein
VHGQIVRDLLEDFDSIGTRQHTALVSREPHCEHFAENVRAAAVAATMGLASIDYAKRRYCDEEDEVENEALTLDAYIDAYHFTKSYVRDCIGSLRPGGKPEPSPGVFGASIVLERLLSSFFGAHLMYQLGARYEGHAISRIILEQLAWAFEAREAQDLEIVKRIRTTRAVSNLKRFAPLAGKLYGHLSEKTHIDYWSHSEFLISRSGKNAVIHGHGHYVFPECGSVILLLGDLFGLVWEASQFQYIAAPQALEERQGKICPKPDRAYLTGMRDHFKNIDQAVAKAYVVQNTEAGEDSARNWPKNLIMSWGVSSK